MKRDEWGRVLGVCAAVAMMGTGVRAQDAEGEAQETAKTTAQRLADGTLDSVVWEVEGTAPAETVAAGEHAVVPCSVEDADYAMSVGNGTLVWTDDPAPRFAYADALAVEPAVAFTRSLACRAVASDADAAGLRLPRAVEKLSFTNDFTLECYLRVDAGSPQWSRLLEVKRANTLTQGLDAPEQSFTLLLQQATAAPAGGTAVLQMRFDVQTPATNRNGDGFNCCSCQQTVTVGEWFHFALTYTAATRQCATYVNGGSKSTAQRSALPNDIQVDDPARPLAFFPKGLGAVGYVKFSPRVLAQGELLPNRAAGGTSMADPVAGPVRGWWRFEKGVNGAAFQAADLASEANAAWWTQAARGGDGRLGFTNDVYSARKTRLFDGDALLAKKNAGALVVSNAYLTIPHTRALAATNFTVECFFRDSGRSSTYATVLQRRRADVVYEDPETGESTGAYGMSSWFLTVGPNGTLRLRCDSVPETGVKPDNGGNWNQCRDGTKSVRDGRWHHVAVTYDDPTRTCRLYVDYALDAALQTAFPLPPVPGAFVIGCNNAISGRQGDYAVDEVRYTAEVLPVERFLRFQADPGTALLLR